MAVATYTSSGTKATTAAKLDKAVFEVLPKNNDVLHRAYVAYLANGRENVAHTKTRGDVSGGGRKPWRQKGTGRARFGSSRVPIWRGGGITFGPTGNENYTKQVPLAIKRLALKQALSLAVKENRLSVIQSIKFTEPKTTQILNLFKKMGVTGRILLVVEHKDPVVGRSIANLSDVKEVQAQYLNVFDLLNADQVIVTADALKVIETWLGEDK